MVALGAELTLVPSEGGLTTKKLILVVIDGLTPSMFEAAVSERATPTLAFLATRPERRPDRLGDGGLEEVVEAGHVQRIGGTRPALLADLVVEGDLAAHGLTILGHRLPALNTRRQA